MSQRRVVVDGSNIATQNRAMPSLAQLDEAVRAWQEEHPDDEVIVVVDATFGHRIPPEERTEFDEAVAHNELIHPPAGVIGRGDAFLLTIAEKTDAVVLSNDSFQEFHGRHEWLFESGRLVGGMPVPGAGWVFMERTPVRGQRSREAQREARRTRARVGSKEASQPMPVPAEPPPAYRPRSGVSDAVAAATAEATGKDDGDRDRDTSSGDGGDGGGGRRRRRRRRSPAPDDLPAMNDPVPFLDFVAKHPRLGAEFTGRVDRFTSHGAFLDLGNDVEGYLPLSGMGDPPPRSARQVLNKGEERRVVLQAYDPPRRGIEVALPGFALPSAQPTDETIEEEIRGRRRPAKKAPKAPVESAAEAAPAPREAEEVEDAATRVAEAVAVGEAPARGGPPHEPAVSEKKPTKKAAKKRAPAKKAGAEAAAPAPKKAAKKAAKKKTAAEVAEPAARKTAKRAAKAEDVTKEPAKKKAKTAKAETPAKEPAKKKAAKAAKATKEPAKKKTAKAPAKKKTAKAPATTAAGAGAEKAGPKKAPAKKAAEKTAKKATKQRSASGEAEPA